MPLANRQSTDPVDTENPVDTEKLLAEAQAGDRHAFGALFALHREEIRRFVELRLSPKLRSRIDASDVVQETQIEAYLRLNEFLDRKPMPFRVWLIKTAYQKVVEAYRHHVAVAGRSVDREMVLTDQSSWPPLDRFVENLSTPSRQLSREETSREVAQVLSELIVADREMLTMRFFEDRPYDEIGCLLGIAPGTARKRYARVLMRLRKSLLESGLLES